MKDKKLEANLSLVVSRIFAGLNMNALKFLLPVWMGALTGVTVRCTFCCCGVLGDRLVCERSAYHTAAAYRVTLSGGIRHVWFYVLLFAGYQ